MKRYPECPKLLSKLHKDKNRKENILKKKKYDKERYKIKRNRILKQCNEYRDNNKEKIAEYQKEWYEKNKEKVYKQQKEYREKEKNKAKHNEYQKEYHKKRRKIDMQYRLLHSLRSRVNGALHKKNKSLSTMFLVGCDIDYLMCYLQKQFTEGMSWDNYGRGGWEIDHIKPCVLFDLSKPSEQRKCFNFKNLQPLWFEDNRIKHNKY